VPDRSDLRPRTTVHVDDELRLVRAEPVAGGPAVLLRGHPGPTPPALLARCRAGPPSDRPPTQVQHSPRSRHSSPLALINRVAASPRWPHHARREDPRSPPQPALDAAGATPRLRP